MNPVPSRASAPSTLVVALSGDLDVTRTAVLDDLAQTYADGAFDSVELDLAGVPFVDAAAVAALVRLHDLAARRGGTLTLRGASRPVAKVLALTGADELVVLLPRTDLRLVPSSPG
jgi:anti-sigma B factor antagonist